jgi:HK97 family phage major capsid protein
MPSGIGVAGAGAELTSEQVAASCQPPTGPQRRARRRPARVRRPGRPALHPQAGPHVRGRHDRPALEIDAAFLTGTGTSNTITGFTAVAGTSGVTLGASVVPTIDNLLDAQGSLLAANASLDSAAWFMHPDMFTRLRKIREGSGSGTYMLMNGDAGIAAGAPTGPGTTFRLLGVPVRVSTQVPGAQAGGKIILADMNQVAVGRDTAPSLGVFTETFADSDQLYLRVVARYDIKPLNAAGIYIITTA